MPLRTVLPIIEKITRGWLLRLEVEPLLLLAMPPGSPVPNQLWWESDTGNLFIYYDDGTSSQWVFATNVAAGGAVMYSPQALTASQKSQARASIDVLKKNYIDQWRDAS
jgi:hypothetical protein